jgi:beta-phosphoglucomutase-like phosphatase (HAD superfamily)
MKAIVFDVDGMLLDSLGPHVLFCYEMNEINLIPPQRKRGLRLEYLA